MLNRYSGHSGAQGRFYPGNIKSVGTFNLKVSAGNLGYLTINNPGTSWVLTIYDGLDATGSLIGTIAVPAAFVGTLTYHSAFQVGLTVVSSGTPGDCTVGYE